VALGLGGAAAARPDIEAQRGAPALRPEGEPALPTGVPMTELDNSTWGRSATGGERQRRMGQGGRQREETDGVAPFSPSYGVASSTTARWCGASDSACRIGIVAASDTAVRTGVIGAWDFYMGKWLQNATAQLGQSEHGAAQHRQ
jgi:hypothetical protein